MPKAEWGTKRSCPKCGARFYDLGKDDPIVCIECGNEWVPEPILKAKQPVIAQAKPKEAEDADDEDEEDVDLDADDDSDDDDDVLGDVSLDDDDTDMSDVIDKSASSDGGEDT